MNVKAQTKRFFVWDAYWDTARLQSFDLEGKPGAISALGQYWASVAQSLPQGASVLDLGCGHGAASLALLAAGSKATITAIDEANIDPVRYLPEKAAQLSRITFRPRVQMEELPFEDMSFDAVVSQFGIEFGPLPKTATEIARVLKPGGFMAALVLPYNSEAVQEARIALKQCRYLLTEAKLFETAITMLQAYHQAPPDVQEPQMQAALDQFRKTVEDAFAKFSEKEINVLSVIVNALYQVFGNRKTATEQDQIFAIESARTHLAHYAARAQDTARSAVDINMTALRGALVAAGIQLSDARPMQAQGYKGLVAYQLFGRKLAKPPQQQPAAGA
ncbi:MAG: class I SAM-dependent methyltransferase [Rhodospirillaceae bacterium]|nr:class I SAM-dependent methyltransferase [Rhodospirillaceae bacterium]